MRSPWASQPSLSGKRSTRTNRTPRFTNRRATRHMQANAADRSSGSSMPHRACVASASAARSPASGVDDGREYASSRVAIRASSSGDVSRPGIGRAGHPLRWR
jgi:hypothetical protein